MRTAPVATDQPCRDLRPDRRRRCRARRHHRPVAHRVAVGDGAPDVLSTRPECLFGTDDLRPTYISRVGQLRARVALVGVAAAAVSAILGVVVGALAAPRWRQDRRSVHAHRRSVPDRPPVLPRDSRRRTVRRVALNRAGDRDPGLALRQRESSRGIPEIAAIRTSSPPRSQEGFAPGLIFTARSCPTHHRSSSTPSLQIAAAISTGRRAFGLGRSRQGSWGHTTRATVPESRAGGWRCSPASRSSSRRSASICWATASTTSSTRGREQSDERRRAVPGASAPRRAGHRHDSLASARPRRRVPARGRRTHSRRRRHRPRRQRRRDRLPRRRIGLRQIGHRALAVRLAAAAGPQRATAASCSTAPISRRSMRARCARCAGRRSATSSRIR